MILFDFSSISCDSTIVESIRVSRNKVHLADLRRVALILDQRARRRRDLVTRQVRTSVRCVAARALAISSRSWPTVAGIVGERAGQMRMIEAAGEHGADRRVAACEQPLLLRREIALRANSRPA